MLRSLAAILFLFIIPLCGVKAQKSYQRWRAPFDAKQNNSVKKWDSASFFQEKNALEEYVKHHPKAYGAFYDLGMMNYMQFLKSGKHNHEFAEAALNSFDSYLHHCPKNQRAFGSWNKMVLYSVRGNQDLFTREVNYFRKNASKKLYRESTDEIEQMLAFIRLVK